MRVICVLALVGAASLFGLRAAGEDVDGYEAGKEALDSGAFDEALEIWAGVLAGRDPRIVFGPGCALLVKGGEAEIEQGLGLLGTGARSGHLPAQALRAVSKLESVYTPQDLEGCLTSKLEAPLYERLRCEGRPRHDPWWLHADYCSGEGMFHPRHRTAEELEAGHHRARTEFNTWRSSA